MMAADRLGSSILLRVSCVVDDQSITGHNSHKLRTKVE